MRRFSTLRSLPAGSLKSTLLLPKTTLPIRPSLDAAKHKALLKKSTTDLYAQQSLRDPAESGSFILHDGPPYANGALHLGHALNKILKDVVNRVQVLDGKRVVFIPGWDCHGLPIELKALQGASGAGAAEAVERSKSMTPLEIRTLARKLATETVTEQKKGFKEWAVMADWDRAYKTMDKHYEILQLEVFRDMVQRGLIYRRFKPVYWSPSSGTALAEAELEYNEKHASKAAFIKFELREEVIGQSGVAVLIWTTTPWTIPANKAVAVGEKMEYAVVQTVSHGKLLVARERVEYLQEVLGEEVQSVGDETILGKDLVGLSYTHPLLPAEPACPIITADFVSADSGTGLVHLAPGHGMDDYLVCMTHKILPFSPVDNNGRYTTDTLPELHGKEVLYAGTKAVLELLKTSKALLHLQNKYIHKYPYDWRTKLPVIVRATAQWFADAESIKADAVAALENVRFIPETGRSRLTSFVRGRSEWCISRQRAWGVPIPALYDAETGEPLLSEQSVNHVISVLGERGTDAWFDPAVSDEVFLAPEYVGNGKTYIRGKETMDVWFDSGTSWATLSSRLGTTPAPGAAIADLYLEGSDQHRGWFQSSLITSIAARSAPPFKQILTHGFTLDSKGKKMSKSLGNVVSPSDVINSSSSKGASPSIDILRLWVASCDFTKDTTIGPTMLAHVHEILRKARVTSRFLLGILEDWNGVSTPYAELTKIDQLALAHVHRVNTTARASLLSYNFNRAVTNLAAYTSADLSAFYLDIIKDRVYSSAADSPARRSAQTVAALVLRNYVSLLAAIVPVLTQEVWSHAPKTVLAAVPPQERDMLQFFAPEAQWENPELVRDFEALAEVHAAVKLGIERAKTAGRVKVNLETGVEIVVATGGKLQRLLKRYEDELEALFIVSGVRVGESGEAAEWEEVEEFVVAGEKGRVLVRKARGEKCVRCWVYKAPAVGGVCGRCETVLQGMQID